MTNLQKFFSSSPGVIFLFVLSVLLISVTQVSAAVGDFLEPLYNGDRAQLLSLTALLIIALGFSSVACSLIVGRIWDAAFYFFGGGYDREEYEPVRQALLAKLSDNCEAQNFLTKLKIQPIYGTILHSYAPTSYIEWLGRRWTSFNNSGLQSCASFLATLASLLICIVFELPFPPWTMLIFFGGIIPLITMYIGRARLREVLASEEFFCRSLVDEDLNNALVKISSDITKRGGSTDGVAELGPRL